MQGCVEQQNEILAMYREIIDGWNAGSGEAFVAPFSENADFVAFDGTRFKGRAVIAAFHQGLFETHLRGTRLTGTVLSVRLLGPHIILLSTIGGTILPGRSSPSPERDSVQTLVARKRNGKWQVEAFQNTRLRPIGRSFAGTALWLMTDFLWRLLHAVRRNSQSQE
jgi:uncharacterized protein (TIGR02246 family)